MKLYRYLMLMGLLGIAATGANAGPIPIDPGIILRGGGGSIPITGLTFAGTFPQPAGNPSGCTDPNCIDYNNANDFTFSAIHLFFTSSVPLTYTCDNSVDPFYTGCSVSGNEVTFACAEGSFCGGIGSGAHFSLAITDLPSGDTASFRGFANTGFSPLPEPASALLFVIAMGAIALVLKRRSNLISA